MQYSQEHLKTMVYAKFGGQTECIMGNSKIENSVFRCILVPRARLSWSRALWRRERVGAIPAFSMNSGICRNRTEVQLGVRGH